MPLAAGKSGVGAEAWLAWVRSHRLGLRRAVGADLQGRRYWALGRAAGCFRIYVEEEQEGGQRWGWYEGGPPLRTCSHQYWFAFSKEDEWRWATAHCFTDDLTVLAPPVGHTIWGGGVQVGGPAGSSPAVPRLLCCMRPGSCVGSCL